MRWRARWSPTASRRSRPVSSSTFTVTGKRMLVQQTGMTFGRWRQQLSIMLALQWLAGGATIQQVAIDLGYESAGSFVTMFRKALGTTPGRYMAERQGTRRSPRT
ncbi:AraC family transcriptional regulator [Bradyrhizobium sp. BRP22]|nr:AraC family transcriptional regulator [Bradyrhizobium sp. BRP22]